MFEVTEDILIYEDMDEGEPEPSLTDQIDIAELNIALGNKLVPGYYYGKFIAELLDMSIPPKVRYQEVLGRWTIKTLAVPNPVANEFTYGTKRMNALDIILHTMNASSAKVRDKDDGDSYVVNEEETLLVKERQKEIIRAFREWIYNNDEALERIKERYIEKFAGFGLKKYDPDKYTFPGLPEGFELYKHQKSVITRILDMKDSRALLIAHDTGAGKTNSMVVAAHELKRRGMAKKILFVIPNAVFDTFIQAHVSLYPKDRLYVIYPKDFYGYEKQMKVIDHIRNEEYDAVYMAHSTYNILTMSKEYYLAKQHQEIRRCTAELEAAKDVMERRSLQKHMDKLSEAYMHTLSEEIYKDTACFDSLGFDAVFIDECHNYKNVTIDCRMDNVSGLSVIGSKKCDQNMEKVHWILNNVGGYVIFATGTPIKKSIAEQYIYMLYLQKNTLEFLGFTRFSEWVKMFCETKEYFENDIDTQRFRNVTQLNFHNLPELMMLFSQVCDYYRLDKSTMDLPEMEDYEDIIIPKSKEQETFYQQISKKIDDVRRRNISRREYNDGVV